MSNKELLRRVAEVDRPHEETMQDNPTMFTLHALPFYRKFKLLRASVRLPHRPLEFRYADDGSKLIILGATPEHIYQVNRQEGLHLNAAQIPAYVRFFLENTNELQVNVIERPAEVQWLRKAGEDPDLESIKQRVGSLLHPMRVNASSKDSYSVSATAMRGSDFIEMRFRVNSDGHVEVESERLLLANLPVPQVMR